MEEWNRHVCSSRSACFRNMDRNFTGFHRMRKLSNNIWEVNMLTGKQKRFLRSEAHHLNPIFQVGKGGVNENMIKQIAKHLKRES